MKIFNPKSTLVLSSQVIAAYGDVTEKDLQWHLQLLTAMAARKNKPLIINKSLKIKHNGNQKSNNCNS